MNRRWGAPGSFAEPVDAFEVDVERVALAAFNASEAARMAPYLRRARIRIVVTSVVLAVFAIGAIALWLAGR